MSSSSFFYSLCAPWGGWCFVCYASIIACLFINVKPFLSQFLKLVSKPIDIEGETCYTGSMKTQDKLTPGNIKLVGVPLALHARLKAEAKAKHVAIHEVIADGLDAREKLVAVSAITGGDNAND